MIMAAHTVIDLCVYVFGTPELALQQDYLARILPKIFGSFAAAGERRHRLSAIARRADR